MTLQKTPIRLWLDDVRDPFEHGHIGWVWAKTANDAIALLETGLVVEASLDHDLSIEATLGQWENEETGYDVVCWMEEHNVWPVNGTRVHSMNPAGKQRMEQVINKCSPR